MPEGLEKGLSVQDFADLIAFVSDAHSSRDGRSLRSCCSRQRQMTREK